MNNKRKGIGRERTEKILERDVYVCGYCNGIAVLADHIVPWAYTHDDEDDNLIACCLECNQIAAAFVFDTLAEKRQYIMTIRAGRKWSKRIKHKYSRCSVCGELFSEGHKGATHFICFDCVQKGYEYRSERDIDLHLAGCGRMKPPPHHAHLGHFGTQNKKETL